MMKKERRKFNENKNETARVEHVEAEDDGGIPWKDVTPHDPSALLSGSSQGGFMCLEEVDGEFFSHFNGNGMETLVEEDGGIAPSLEGSFPEHKTAKKRKKVVKKKRKEVTGLDEVLADKERTKAKRRRKEQGLKIESGTHEAENCSTETSLYEDVALENSGPNAADVVKDDNEEVPDDNLSAWKELRLHEQIMKALSVLNFTEPTLIQKACIPAAAHQGKDVIGAAETGSGKTLAYVIPILQRLLDEEKKFFHSGHEGVVTELSPESNRLRGSLRALILTPTRELALQVCNHFRAAAKFTMTNVVPIVGGMSLQKQERLLKRRPQVVVGTPGRLWELMSAGDQHLTELRYLSFFVLDEADRMVEKGHFQELQSIMSMLPVVDKRRVAVGSDTESSFPTGDMASTENISIVRRQTFLFSATLALPVGFRKKLKKGHLQLKQQAKGDEYSVALLAEHAGIRPNAVVIDLTSKSIIVDKLEESVIQCREEEKDLYLYYVLKLHGAGRAIIFCTSIAAVRHVSAILGLLQIQAWPLHAQMQQRQRLKAMDRFQGGENSCLISTDVAARGLDIPGVRTVIHYQLPHSAEVYVHRSGRTARASKDGCSILLLTPSDEAKFRSLCSALSKKDMLPPFPCNSAYIPAIVKRVQLAQKIDALLRKNAQTKARKNWFKRNADALEVAVEDVDKDDDVVGNISEKKAAFELKKLQQELELMLEQPLEPKSFSHRFITGAGMSPLLAGQLKDYAKQKVINKQGRSNKKAKKAVLGGQEKQRRGLVVIGQEMLEPLSALQISMRK